MIETTINIRVQRIIDEAFEGNKSAFAQKVGIPATVVENIVGKRQGKPSFDVLVAIFANANISAKWLLTGEGDMLLSEKDSVLQPGISNNKANMQQNRDIQDNEKDIQIAKLQSQVEMLQQQIAQQTTIINKLIDKQ